MANFYWVNAEPSARSVLLPAKLAWDFREGFFPRRVCGKKSAEHLADEAESKGGQNVRVVKEVKRHVCPNMSGP